MKSKMLSWPYIGWMAIFIVAPLFIVGFFALTTRDGGFSLENFAHMMDYAPIFGRSFQLSFAATAICLLIGYPVAAVLCRLPAKRRAVGLLLVILPMWMSFLLRTYAWMSILENNGLLNRLLEAIGLPTIHIINTPAAVLLGMVYNYLPFMILPIYTVMMKMDRRLIEAAQDLGANSFQVMRRVTLPLVRPGILSGVTVVFIPGVSTFLISSMLGGGKVMMVGDLIDKQFVGVSYNPNLGSAIALVMMLLIFIFMGIVNRFDKSGEGVGAF